MPRPPASSCCPRSQGSRRSLRLMSRPLGSPPSLPAVRSRHPRRSARLVVEFHGADVAAMLLYRQDSCSRLSPHPYLGLTDSVPHIGSLAWSPGGTVVNGQSGSFAPTI